MITSESIREYLRVKATLDKAKKDEKKLRVEILDEVFPSAVEGTLNEANNGFLIKGGFALSYKIDKEALEDVELTEEEAECIKWTPSIIKQAYKDLDESERENLDSCVIISQSLPTLKITSIEE